MSERVKWVCGFPRCTKRCHYGTVTFMSYRDAAEAGLTLDPPADVGVVFDDRPGVVQHHSWAELERLEPSTQQ